MGLNTMEAFSLQERGSVVFLCLSMEALLWKPSMETPSLPHSPRGCSI